MKPTHVPDKSEAQRADECNAAVKKIGLAAPALDRAAESAEVRLPTSNSPYSHHCKIDNIPLANCDVVLVSFDSLSCVTQEHSTGAGALLLEIEEKDTWFPKKLCSNLDLEAGQVRVWTPFMRDKMPELYESIMTYGQEQEEGVRSEGEL